MGGNLLLLEGRDDIGVLFHLMNRHTIPIARGKALHPDQITIEDGEGIAGLLRKFRGGLKIQDDDAPISRLGIIVDADLDIAARWRQIGDILRAAGYTTVPLTPDGEGTVLQEPDRMAVGVWLMPNNRISGAIEQFVHTLIPVDDRLWERAYQNVQDIPDAERRFSNVDVFKAQMHTWLAWQSEPGLPMGQALHNHYFDAQVPQALQLVAWIRRLFPVDTP